jgi:hypothetical protein
VFHLGKENCVTLREQASDILLTSALHSTFTLLISYRPSFSGASIARRQGRRWELGSASVSAARAALLAHPALAGIGEERVHFAKLNADDV